MSCDEVCDVLCSALCDCDGWLCNPNECCDCADWDGETWGLCVICCIAAKAPWVPCCYKCGTLGNEARNEKEINSEDINVTAIATNESNLSTVATVQQPVKF